jgi:hypothetical protein
MKSWTLTLTGSAIFGIQHAVTVDRHIAQMLSGVSTSTAKHCDQAEALLRELATKFGWKPKEVQADRWVAWNAQGLRNTQVEQGKNATALEDYFPSAGGAFERGCEQEKGVLFQHEPIKVVLPHGEMELHPVGNVLSREEYYKLTQAVGLLEARTVMSHHGLVVGEVPLNDLAAVGERGAGDGAGAGAGSGSNVRFAERTSDADLTRFAPELAA